MPETNKAGAAKRTLAKSKFTRHLKSLTKSLDDGLSEKTISSRYDALQSAWEDVQSRHDEYMETISDHPDIEEQDSWIDSVSADYFAIQGRVDKHLEGLERDNLDLREAARKADENKSEAEKRARESQEFFLLREQEYLKFANLLKALEGLVNKTEHDEAQHISEAVKDTKLKLDHAVSCCDEAQKRYVTVLDNERALAETEWSSKIWDLYSKISSEAQIFISRHGNLTSTYAPKSKVATTSSGIKLEKIRLRQFSGDIRQYPKFKSEFKKHVEPLCDPREIAFVLRLHISDEVCYDVENPEDDMEKIWECLDRKYGDKGKLVDNIMADIKGMDECLDGVETHTLHFINIVEKADMDLRLLGKEDEMRNSTIVGFIEERLSKEMRKEWTQIVTGARCTEISVNKFPHLLEYLLQYKEQIEYNVSQIRYRQPPEHKVITSRPKNRRNNPS